MRFCSVPGCLNMNGRQYHIPQTEHIKQVWLERINDRRLLELKQIHLRTVCKNHFHPYCINGINDKLKKTSLPTLNIPGYTSDPYDRDIFYDKNQLKAIRDELEGNCVRKTIKVKSFASIKNFATMARPKVYVTRAMNKEVIEILEKECDVTSWAGTDPVPQSELSKNIEEIDGLFCMLTDKISGEILNKAKNLKVISTMSVGYDHLDIEEIKKKGIKVGYTPETLTDATAELTVGLLLATCRRLMEANAAAKEGQWLTWSPFWMCGNSLKNATVGFFGFGRIGQEIARRLIPFKTSKILYTARSEKPEAREMGASKVDFDCLLQNSDFIVVCCSFNESTREKFDLQAFKKMRKNAVFINTARGAVVKQDDLVLALKEKLIWGAGLDVTTPEPLPVDNELFKLDNCVVLPHIGSAATDCRLEMAALTAANIITALKGEPMPSELVLN